MSDRVEKLYVPGYNEYGHYDRKATFDEVLAVVRRGVESGTIKGKVVWTMTGYIGTGRKGRFLVVPIDEERHDQS